MEYTAFHFNKIHQFEIFNYPCLTHPRLLARISPLTKKEVLSCNILVTNALGSLLPSFYFTSLYHFSFLFSISCTIVFSEFHYSSYFSVRNLGSSRFARCSSSEIRLQTVLFLLFLEFGSSSFVLIVHTSTAYSPVLFKIDSYINRVVVLTIILSSTF